MRASFGVVVAVILSFVAGGCRSLTPTRPATPLPDDRLLALGASGTLGVGWQAGEYRTENDVFGPYASLLVGPLATVRLARLGDFSLELDAGVGVAGETTARPLGYGVGGLFAVRNWWRPHERLALGLDLSLGGGLELGGNLAHFPAWTWLQPELHVIAAWRFLDDLWLTTRPGVLHQLGFAGPSFALSYPPSWLTFSYLEVPLGVSLDLGSMRVTAEAALSSTLFVPPLPSARVGAAVSWMW